MLSLNYESIDYAWNQILKLSCVSFGYISTVFPRIVSAETILF
jgi:hypothetical protein